MEQEILLAQLRAHLERAAQYDNYNYGSKELLIWLSQGYALVAKCDIGEAVSFKVAWKGLKSLAFGADAYNDILAILHRVMATLELEVPQGAEITFGSGEVYNFFRALNKVIGSAEKSIFIIDPYLDNTVFDHYLNAREPAVVVRLLIGPKSKQIKPAGAKYVAQYGPVLEVKQSNKTHDRVIFIDGYACWIFGQSIKDAAKAKPTYLAPLSPDVVTEKLEDYEAIWKESNAI
jgi:hypothetical protein